MRRIILAIVVTIIFTLGADARFIFNGHFTPALLANAGIGKCGDNICDEFERTRPGVCPEDCANQPSEDYSAKNYFKCDINKDGKVDLFEEGICHKNPSLHPEPQVNTGIGKCGDNICDNFENANPNACPADCKSENTNNEKNYQCPQYTPPAPSFYKNCRKQGGTVMSSGKDDKGCLSPARCILSEKSGETTKDNRIIGKNSPFGALPFFSFSEPVKKNSSPPGPEKLDFKPTEDLGIKWGRAHYLLWQLTQPTKEDVDNGIYDWSNTDKFIGSFPKGLNAVENIVGFSTQATDEKGAPSHGFTFPNKELENFFANFIKKAVERYDGDGKDDMPDLKSPIKYWQVENEPDLSSKDIAGLVNLQKITYAAVKSSCADCKVLLGGMAGEMKGLREFFEPTVKDLGGKYFDIFDYHCYGDKNDWKRCGDLADEIRKAFPNYDFEIWLTETGTMSGGIGGTQGKPYKKQTEKEQAEALIKYYVYPLSKNVKKIFWAWGILEGFGEDGDTLFNKTGLIYDGQDSDDPGFGVKKLGYYTYKKMVEVLEGSDWNNIQTVQEKDGVHVYEFIKNGKPIWVAWNDNNSEQQITISSINSSSIKITEAVPNYESGKEVKDYNTAFKTETKQIISNELTITLNETPIFAEGN